MANANIALVRVDTRMVHGSVVKAWAAKCKTRNVYMIDSFLKADPFMVNFYKKGKKRPVKIEVEDAAEAGQKYAAGNFGPEDETIMVIAKDAENAYTMWKNGFELTELNLGKIVYEDGKREITHDCFLNEAEIALFEEMIAGGVHVFVQFSPSSEPIEWPEAMELWKANGKK